MLSNTFIIGITGLLIIIYFWRVLKFGNGIIKELLIFVLLFPIIFSALFVRSSQILPKTSSVSQNVFENLALKIPNNLIYQAFSTSQDPSGPKIKIIFPQDGQVFTGDINQIVVKAEVLDENDPSPVVEGVGTYGLQIGLNPIIVTAVDKDGHVSSAFVIVKKLP